MMSKAKSIRLALSKLKNKAWDFIDNFNNDEVYVPDNLDIIRKYVDYDIKDLEEFAATYTYEYHESRRILDDKKSKVEMYKRVYIIMKSLEKRGCLED